MARVKVNVTKRAEDVKPGDIVLAEDGQHKVTDLTPGFWRESVIVGWVGGWGCLDRSALVEVLV